MQHDNSETNSTYFDTARYACEVLGHSAGKYLTRLFDLSRYNSADELKAIVDGWANGLRIVVPDRRQGPWAVGAKWGETTRIERDSGIIWKVRCRCGKYFKVSTNDTVPEERRKCDNCRLVDELSEQRQVINKQLESTAATVVEWHRRHDKLVWLKVHTALRARGIDYGTATGRSLANDLHAMCWAKLTSVADQYDATKGKLSGWIAQVAKNAIADHFKVQGRRDELAPPGDMPNKGTPAVATKPEEIVPAQPSRPVGASPKGDALNSAQSNYDAKLGREWSL